MDINGDITKFDIQDIPELFGVGFDSYIKWHDIENSNFDYDSVNEHSINIKFKLEDNISEFTAEEVKG